MKPLDGKRGVLFDFDETLVDSFSGAKNAWKETAKLIQEFLEKKGIPIDLISLQNEIEQIANVMNRKREYNRDKWWEQLLRQKVGSHFTKEFVTQVTENYWEALIEGSELYSDTLAILRYLQERGYRLGLLTDTDHVKAMKWKRIKQSGLEEWFEAIVVSGEDGIEMKPDPEPFHVVARRINLSPEECVFIGDKPFLDIKGAKAAGMTTILIHRRPWDRSVEPDYIVETLQELQELL